MRITLHLLCTGLLLASSCISLFAQKISVGYDKSTDFRKFTTYTWAQPSAPPTRPLLYESVVGSVDYELKAKGLTRTDDHGDLILIPAGGMEFGLNVAAPAPYIPSYSGQPPVINATMWTGATGATNLTALYVPEGSLVLTFVDPRTDKIVWSGTVKEKLDTSNRKKALERVDNAIVKLLKRYPPPSK